mmetsp:Transcript_35067/g.68265  ORF Transcript_35067/g.68265 Transcript_35067/m.68265 type:complete len:236 (+) Transcript_35067:1198-1905(+)
MLATTRACSSGFMHTPSTSSSSRSLLFSCSTSATSSPSLTAFDASAVAVSSFSFSSDITVSASLRRSSSSLFFSSRSLFGPPPTSSSFFSSPSSSPSCVAESLESVPSSFSGDASFNFCTNSASRASSSTTFDFSPSTISSVSTWLPWDSRVRLTSSASSCIFAACSASCSSSWVSSSVTLSSRPVHSVGEVSCSSSSKMRCCAAARASEDAPESPSLPASSCWRRLCSRACASV